AALAAWKVRPVFRHNFHGEGGLFRSDLGATAVATSREARSLTATDTRHKEVDRLAEAAEECGD
ncbi:MAG TPA: hypothetical protein VGF84_21315, partial [Micromonosporaceae bacterium]